MWIFGFLAPSGRGLRPQAVGERASQQPGVFRIRARFNPSGPAGPPPLLGEARRDDYLIGHKLCALIIDQRAALSFSVIFMLRQLGR